MKPSTAPSKEQVRSFMAERQKAATPPPSLEEIRRQMGWHLIPANAGR